MYIFSLYIFVNCEANKKMNSHEPAPKWRTKISPTWLHLLLLNSPIMCPQQICT